MTSDPEDQSTSSDSDSEPGTPRQVTTNPFGIRKNKPAKGVGTQMKWSGTKDKMQSRSALVEGNIDFSGTTNSRPQKDHQNKELAGSSSESDDLPILSGRKRNGPAVAIIVSSGDESEVNHISPRRRSKRVDVKDERLHTRRQSRPISSPRVNARRFLLGGSTGNAPVPRSRLQKVVTPTKPSKGSTQASARRHTRSSGKAEQEASPITRHTRSSQPRAAPTILDRKSNDGILDDDKSDQGVLMSSEVGSTAAQTSIKAVVIAGEESEEDLVLSPKKRRRLIRLNEDSPTHTTGSDVKQQQDDLQGDLEDLKETGE